MSENERDIELEGDPLLYMDTPGGEQIITTEGRHHFEMPKDMAAVFFGGVSPFESTIRKHDGVPAVDLSTFHSEVGDEEFERAVKAMPMPSPDALVSRGNEWDEENGNLDRVPVNEFLDFWRENGQGHVRFGQVRNGELVWEDQEAA